MHDIIFLWSHPRSLSTALERVMLERGDLRTFHEPFLHLYYVGDARKALAHFEPLPGHPTDYAGIRRMVLDAAEAGPVFVKDMCYYAVDYLLEDTAFLQRVKNTFLIRDPARAILSYYKLDPDFTLEEIGLDAQYRVFEQVARLSGAMPPVVDADDLQADSEATLRAYCTALGIAHVPEALQWSGPLPEAWRFVAGWHSGVARSSGISAAGSAEPVDLDADPRLREAYRHHLPFYERMHRHRLRIVDR